MGKKHISIQIILFVWILMPIIVYSKDLKDCSNVPIRPSNQGWKTEDGRSCSDTNYYKSIGKFSARLLLVTDNDFFTKWKTPSLIFHTYEKSYVERGNDFIVVVIFANAKPDSYGEIDMVVDYKVTKANGEIDGELKNLFCARGVKARPENILEHCRDYIVVEIKANDPLGSYRVDAVIRDNNSADIIKLWKTINVK